MKEKIEEKLIYLKENKDQNLTKMSYEKVSTYINNLSSLFLPTSFSPPSSTHKKDIKDPFK